MVLVLALCLLTGCSAYIRVQKVQDFDYRYEFAKTLYSEGRYQNASSLLSESILRLRGTERAEESTMMLADCYYQMEDYLSASQYYQMYYNSYPKGAYAEFSRYRSGKCLFLDTPDPRLDQTSTSEAMYELQTFLEMYPYSDYAAECNEMIYTMYDRLVEKQLKSAKLYYNLGLYMGNNYKSSIITAQNALRDYPGTKFREDLLFLILKANFKQAEESVVEKKIDRYRDTIDEYYAFKNEFPESENMKEADKMFHISEKYVNKVKTE